MKFKEYWMITAMAGMMQQAQQSCEPEEPDWSEQLQMLEERQAEMQEYLDSVGCTALHLFDTSVIETGTYADEMRKIDEIQAGVEEYLELGGDIEWLIGFSDLEQRIDVLRYLKEIGRIDRQYEFINDDRRTVEEIIRAERASGEIN
ncbi:MAG: hypothetical protein MR896_07045 [Clostridiales bacterium]|nr:hypothetical protein [Clostridiales bacterium]